MVVGYRVGDTNHDSLAKNGKSQKNSATPHRLNIFEHRFYVIVMSLLRHSQPKKADSQFCANASLEFIYEIAVTEGIIYIPVT